MPIISRVSWLLRQLEIGRQMHLVYSVSADGNSLKIKVVLSPPREANNASPYVTQALEQQLQYIKLLVTQNLCTDRGHKHTNGTSYVHIWVRPPPVPISIASATLTHTLRAEALEFTPIATPIAPQLAGSGAAAGASDGTPDGGGELPSAALNLPLEMASS